MTEWDAFRALDPARLRKVMAAPVIVDLRNVYDEEALVDRCRPAVGIAVDRSGAVVLDQDLAARGAGGRDYRRRVGDAYCRRPLDGVHRAVDA